MLSMYSIQLKNPKGLNKSLGTPQLRHKLVCACLYVGPIYLQNLQYISSIGRKVTKFINTLQSVWFHGAKEQEKKKCQSCQVTEGKEVKCYSILNWAFITPNVL